MELSNVQTVGPLAEADNARNEHKQQAKSTPQIGHDKLSMSETISPQFVFALQRLHTVRMIDR